MAEVFIAAGPEEDARARGLAAALATLGFDVAAGAPAEGEIPALADQSKCIVTLFGRTPPSAAMAMLATLAMERRKLVGAELYPDAAPALFRTAPRVEIAPRDRAAFKAKFSALAVEIDKLAPTPASSEALAQAIVKARAALLMAPRRSGNGGWRTAGTFALAVAALFAVGFGAGRVITMARNGEFAFATAPAAATPTAAQAVTQPTALNSSALERTPWRELAARIDEAGAAEIERRAATGDADAQTLACLGRMAGAPGFLPSPNAARELCDAASAQAHAPALYLSWQLHRTAPHAGLSAATATERLRQAADAGFTAAQIDYAATLPGDRTSQTEAGRLWLLAAEDGDPRAQFFYARWLRDSVAGPRDPSAAIPFLERAAAQSQADALHMLATLYRDGIGVSANPQRARELYQRAAQQNHTASMFNLADLLRGGSDADRVQAVALYRQLACLRDERQIQPMAVQRLRALQETYACR